MHTLSLVRKGPPNSSLHRSDYLPMKLVLAYLAGTYFVFLVFGQSAQADDLLALTLFILYTVIAFAVGYSSWVHRNPGASSTVLEASPIATPRILITVCATYNLATSVLYLSRTGSPGMSSLWYAITHPGDSYYAKLHPVVAPTESLTVQVLTVFAAFYALLIPLSVKHWNDMGIALRCYVAISISTYIVYFLSIGTTKGLGDILIFWCAAYSVVRQATRLEAERHQSSRRLRAIVLATIAIGSFAWYMSFSQADRLDARDQTTKHPGNPVVAHVLGDKIASGMAVAIDYPTHGYLGLSYNLQTSFKWTHGVGSMPAVSEYVEKYLHTDQPIRDRYTARTAQRTGWPDGMYWSTIYPWLASDLTFPGAILFMGMVGWFTAKFWREALDGRLLSLALFCQLALLIAFVPANNQIGQGRPSLVGFLTLSLLSINDRIRVRRKNFPAKARSH
jgi:hypothetical protein